MTDKMRYNCHLCGKDFTRKLNLMRHQMKKKACNSGYPCEVCGRFIINGTEQLHVCDKRGAYNKMIKTVKIMEEQNKVQHIEDAQKIKDLEIKLNSVMSVLNGTVTNGTNVVGSTITGNSTNITGNDNTVTNKTVNNITIKLLAFGKENLSYLDEKQYTRLLNKCYGSVVNLTKKVHFNKDHPENHNIYINSLKDGYAMKYDGKKWVALKNEEFLHDLCISKGDHMILQYENMREKLSPEILRKFQRFVDTQEEDVIVNKIKEELKLLLFNNRGLVKTTIKKMKDKK